MRIRLLAVGVRMPSWVEEGVKNYTKRFPKEWQFEVREIAPGKRVGSNPDIARAMADEGEALITAAGRDTLIAFDVRGKTRSTEQIAQNLSQWQMQGDDVSLMIGGPDGFSSTCIAQATQRWSLSALTLPHPLVRVVVVEQLYRAWSINNNHPYHRA